MKTRLGTAIYWKRSTLVDGHKTSVTLEDEFWTALKEIATTQNVGTPKLISMIGIQRDLRSAIVPMCSLCP